MSQFQPYTINVIEQGPNGEPNQRPTLFFVHGGGMGAWVWSEHFLPYFAGHGYHVAALDLRGHGASAGRADLARFRLDDYVDDVVVAATRLAMREDGRAPVLIGHSLGGAIVQRILDQGVFATRAAALLAPIPRGEGWALATQAAIQVFGRDRMTRMRQTRNSALLYETAELARTAFFAPDMPAEQARAYWERLQPESWLDGDLERFARVLPQPVAPPLLVLAGQLDRPFPPEAAKRTANYYQATFEVIEGVAHDMMLDVQWERAADSLRAWLERAGG